MSDNVPNGNGMPHLQHMHSRGEGPPRLDRRDVRFEDPPRTDPPLLGRSIGTFNTDQEISQAWAEQNCLSLGKSQINNIL